MNNRVLLVALLFLISLANSITVYTLDEQFSQANQTVLRFRIENNSNASYGMDFGGDFGVSLGVSASIGNIYSGKSVQLRDRALVFGNIETAGILSMQSSTVGIAGSVTQNSLRASALTALYGPVLNNVVLNSGSFKS